MPRYMPLPPPNDEPTTNKLKTERHLLTHTHTHSHTHTAHKKKVVCFFSDGQTDKLTNQRTAPNAPSYPIFAFL